MNRYLIICRLRWPAMLLLTGVIALLDQAGILRWGRAWPLYLILWGVLALAERATLASQPPVGVNGQMPQAAYPYGSGYPAGSYPATGYAPQPEAYSGPASAPTASSTGIVPAHTGMDVRNTEFGSNREEEER